MRNRTMIMVFLLLGGLIGFVAVVNCDSDPRSRVQQPSPTTQAIAKDFKLSPIKKVDPLDVTFDK